MRAKPSPPKRRTRQALLLGVGLDASDGHRRITRAPDTLLVGGSKETHEVMQEKAIRFREELERRGKRLADVTDPEELRDIAGRAGI